jgi:hypothetical protein
VLASTEAKDAALQLRAHQQQRLLEYATVVPLVLPLVLPLPFLCSLLLMLLLVVLLVLVLVLVLVLLLFLLLFLLLLLLLLLKYEQDLVMGTIKSSKHHALQQHTSTNIPPRLLHFNHCLRLRLR